MLNGADGARFLKTGPFLVLLKSNGRLQATWHRATSLSAVQLVQGFCFCSLPYTFRYVFVNACAFSEPRARATVASTPGAEVLHFSAFHSVCYARTHFSSHRSRQKQAHKRRTEVRKYVGFSLKLLRCRAF